MIQKQKLSDITKDNRYLLYCSHLYSLAILRPLQKVIWERGGETAWFFDNPDAGHKHLNQDEKLLDDVETVKKFNPNAVFVPGNIVPDFFPGIKIEVFHGIANDYMGKKGHFRIRGFFDLYCTRSDKETAQFNEFATKKRHFEVIETGWPKLDTLFSHSNDSRLREKMGITKPIVLYASTFSPSMTSAPHLLEIVKNLSKKGKYYWFITLHPKMPEKIIAKYKNLGGANLTFFEGHENVYSLLRSADVMLCDTSSIFCEFMMLDKPVVTYRTKVPGPHVIDVQDKMMIESAIEMALKRPPNLMKSARKFIDRLHPYRDGLSSNRVLYAANHLISTGISHLKPKPMNLLRKWRIRKRLRYYHLN